MSSDLERVKARLLAATDGGGQVRTRLDANARDLSASAEHAAAVARRCFDAPGAAELRRRAELAERAVQQLRRAREAMTRARQIAEEWCKEGQSVFGVAARASASAISQSSESRAAAETPVSASSAHKGEEAFQIGETWTEPKIAKSGVNGEVTAIEELDDGTYVVHVQPASGSQPRLYPLEWGSNICVNLGDTVQCSQPLGRLDKQYRTVEFRSTKQRRRIEEVLNIRGKWVMRGSERTTLGDIMEDAAERQLTEELTQAMSQGSLREFDILARDGKRSGFDRIVIEYRHDGQTMEAQVRIIEVKGGTGHVPLAEFTAITVNLDANLDYLELLLSGEVRRLSIAGRFGAAAALEAFIGTGSSRIEIWLGPEALLGPRNRRNSVLRKLGERIESRSGDVIMASDRPRRVHSAFYESAVRALGAKGLT